MNASNVTTGKPRVVGAIFRAPLGTKLPTDAVSELDPAFLELGFVSDDGVTNNNTADTDDINAWGGTPVLNIQTEKPDEWTFTLIEALNANVLGTVYGDDNVIVSGNSIHVKAMTAQLKDQVYVIDMAMRDGALSRFVIPVGSLGEVGEIVYKDDEAVGYEITIKGMDDGTGKTHDQYILLPDTGSASITLDKSTLSVAVGATGALEATTTPAGGHVLWGTSDPSKATVDASGVVAGVAAGSATITAYYAGLTATCTVTVTA